MNDESGEAVARDILEFSVSAVPADFLFPARVVQCAARCACAVACLCACAIPRIRTSVEMAESSSGKQLIHVHYNNTTISLYNHHHIQYLSMCLRKEMMILGVVVKTNHSKHY